MRVYRVAYLEGDSGSGPMVRLPYRQGHKVPGPVRYEWCGSLAEARRLVRDVVRAGKCEKGDVPTITSMYVPTKKDGLVSFLNQQARYVRGM